MKKLVLDDLDAPQVVVELAGQDHVMSEMTVAAFRKMQIKSNEDEDEAGLERTVNIVMDSFPTMPREALEQMPFRKLSRLMKFILEVNSEDDDSPKDEGTTQTVSTQPDIPVG